MELNTRVVRTLIAASKNRRIDLDIVKAIGDSFRLDRMGAMSLIRHSLPRDHCVHCAAPLSNVGRFTRHCIVCKGINFDWHAAQQWASSVDRTDTEHVAMGDSQMSQYHEMDTPEERRTWIESVTGLGGSNETFDRIAALMSPFMRKEDVIAAVRAVVNEEPVEKEGVLWIGEYQFTFDDDDRLETGPNWETGSGGMRIVTELG